MTTVVHVLVIAHPDDESMFFLPTLQALVDNQQPVWIMCLTNGNYDGLGKTREKELLAAGKLLGVDKTMLLDNNLLQDHPTQRWDKVVVASAIRTALTRQQSGVKDTAMEFSLLTFDKEGVSGHINHIDTYLGVTHLMVQEKLNRKTSKTNNNNQLKVRDAWQLHTERNVVFKYVPVVSWLMLLASFFVKMGAESATINDNNNTTSRTYRLHKPTLNWNAMATHHSQFVWYRRLFVVFSCYTYYNKLTLISQIDGGSNMKEKKRDR